MCEQTCAGPQHPLAYVGDEAGDRVDRVTLNMGDRLSWSPHLLAHTGVWSAVTSGEAFLGPLNWTTALKTPSTGETTCGLIMSACAKTEPPGLLKPVRELHYLFDAA